MLCEHWLMKANVINKLHFYLGSNLYINDEIDISINGYLQKNRFIYNVGINNKKQVIVGVAFKLR